MNEQVYETKKTSGKLIRHDLCIVAIVGMYVINFYGIGDYIPLLLFLPLIFLFFISKKELPFFHILFSLITLLGMYILIVSFYGYDTFNATIRLLITPISMLLLGYYSINSINKESRYLFILSSVFFFMCLFSVLALLNTNNKFGSYSNAMLEMGNRRFIISYWSQELLTATGITTYLAPALSLLPVGILLQFSKYPVQKIVIFLSFFIATFVSLTLGNRTGVIIIFISLVISISMLIFLGKIKQVLFSLAVIIVVYLLAKNFIVEFDDFTNLMFFRLKNQSLANDSRFETWKYLIGNVKHLTLGGKTIDLPSGIGYSHNFFLDILYYGGYIPFLFSIIFMGLCGRLVWLIKTDRLVKLTIVLVFLGFFLVFMVEPILQGWIVSFSCFCFFIGLTSRLKSLDRQYQ